jgi:hypothetical protein
MGRSAHTLGRSAFSGRVWGSTLRSSHPISGPEVWRLNSGHANKPSSRQRADSHGKWAGGRRDCLGKWLGDVNGFAGCRPSGLSATRCPAGVLAAIGDVSTSAIRRTGSLAVPTVPRRGCAFLDCYCLLGLLQPRWRSSSHSEGGMPVQRGLGRGMQRLCRSSGIRRITSNVVFLHFRF